MTLSDAILSRIMYFQVQRGYSGAELARRSGLSESAIKNLFSRRNYSLRLHTLQQICTGFGITLTEFFDCECFRSLEQEIY